MAGAVALAECVAESSRLLRLDLRENDIKTGGLMALALALKVNQSVTRIDLDQKPKRESVRIVKLLLIFRQLNLAYLCSLDKNMYLEAYFKCFVLRRSYSI